MLAVLWTAWFRAKGGEADRGVVLGLQGGGLALGIARVALVFVLPTPGLLLLKRMFLFAEYSAFCLAAVLRCVRSFFSIPSSADGDVFADLEFERTTTAPSRTTTSRRCWRSHTLPPSTGHPRSPPSSPPLPPSGPPSPVHPSRTLPTPSPHNRPQTHSPLLTQTPSPLPPPAPTSSPPPSLAPANVPPYARTGSSNLSLSIWRLLNLG